MCPELSDEEMRKGRAIIDSYLSAEELELMKKMLTDDSAATALSLDQKEAIRALFKAFGYL